MKKYTKCILLCLVVVISCKKNRPDKLEGDKALIAGNWNWVKTLEVIGCQEFYEENLYSPESKSTEYMLEFEESGHVGLFQENEEIERYFLKFKDFSLKEGGIWRFIILLDNQEEDIVAGSLYGDTLTTNFFPYRYSEDGCDNYINYFVK